MCATPHSRCRRASPARSSRCVCSQRRGIDKDERALAIERAEIERLAKDRDDERDDPRAQHLFNRLQELLDRPEGHVSGPKGIVGKRNAVTDEALLELALTRRPVVGDRRRRCRQGHGRDRAAQAADSTTA